VRNSVAMALAAEIEATFKQFDNFFPMINLEKYKK